MNLEAFLDPNWTYSLFLCVQALHLLHHRLVKRHISFVEFFVAFIAIYQPELGWISVQCLAAIHLILATIQIAGSIWIFKLSPDWQRT